jgi:hypothetical protein
VVYAPPVSDAAPDEPRPADAPAPPAGEGGPAAAPQRSLLPFLIMTVVLGVIGWFLVDWMAETTRIQDCVMSGRKNCAPLDPATGR